MEHGINTEQKEIGPATGFRDRHTFLVDEFKSVGAEGKLVLIRVLSVFHPWPMNRSG